MCVFRAFNVCFCDMKVKYTTSAMPFKQMENIATYLHALSKLEKFKSFDLFSTVDLYEGKNMAQVVRCILACKRFAEKEALCKGIQLLNIKTEENNFSVKSSEEFEVLHEEEENEDSVVVVSADEADDVEDEYKIEQETEPAQFNQMSETETDENDQDSNQEDEYEEQNEPEIVLIDSPVYSENESNSIDKETESSEPNGEEYETFTVENPGTFEIQVSN